MLEWKCQHVNACTRYIHPRQGPVFQIVTVTPTVPLKANTASLGTSASSEGQRGLEAAQQEMAVLQ